MKKHLEKLLNMTLALSLMVHIFAPLAVLADTVDIVLTFTAETNSGIVMQKGEHALGGKLPSASGYSFFGFVQHGTNPETQFDSSKIVTDCNNENTVCTATITVEAGQTIDLTVGGDAGFEFVGNTVNISQDTSITLKVKSEEDPPPSVKDNEGYLVWKCGSKICYKLFEHLEEHNRVNYFKASTVQADNDANEVFNTNADAIMASVTKFNEKKAQIDANTIAFNDLIGSSGIDYEPLRDEPKENNAFVSYANRNYKIYIYNDDYRGIELGNLDDLHYYPREWKNQFVRRESYDISGTSKENPTEVLAVLLEKSINIKLQSFNSFEVSKLEALDVPTGAVVIEDNNDGTYSIEFKSNFYDKVVFKATSTDNKEYYFMVNRRTIDPGFTGRNNNILEAEVFYDNETSYTDYIVLAKIQYKNGNSKIVKMTATKYGEDELGNPIDVIEFDEENPPIDIPVGERGSGIKRTKFIYEMTVDELKTVDKIYINVENKGSTLTSYAGNFAGSGKGDVIDMKDWEDRL